MLEEPVITYKDTGLPEAGKQKLPTFRMRSDRDDQLYVMSDPSFDVFSSVGVTGHNRRLQLLHLEVLSLHLEVLSLHLEVLSLRVIPVNARSGATRIQQAFDRPSFPCV